jgi:hypothetical protein
MHLQTGNTPSPRTTDFVEFYSFTIAQNVVTLWKKFTGFIKNIFIWCWLMNSVTLASSGLMSILSYLSSFSTFFSFLFIFKLDKSLSSGFYVCKADSPLIEPHFQSFCSGYFWRWGLMKYLHITKNSEI